MKFSETVKLIQPDLVVSRRHDQWLTSSDHPQYSAKAMAFALEQLGKADRVRQGTISASSLGECKRYQQFVFIGMPKLPHEPKQALKLHNGSMMHLRWQMAGLTEGWLKSAEVGLGKNAYRLSGTMDGLLYEGSILELKSINNHGFSKVNTFGPLIPHLFQMATYMLCTSLDHGVFIYENKDTQEYFEIGVGADELPMEQAQLRAQDLWNKVESHELVEPLNKCLDREGWIYASCPFRDRCLDILIWDEV